MRWCLLLLAVGPCLAALQLTGFRPDARSFRHAVPQLPLLGRSCHTESTARKSYDRFGRQSRRACSIVCRFSRSGETTPDVLVPLSRTRSRELSKGLMRMAAVIPFAGDMQLLAVGVGGGFAGALHAVTGPDHLAALLPLAIGHRWWNALYTGLYWGLGHGIGAAAVGALAFCMRRALNLDVLCTYMEAAVGISIMVIGYNGINEAREWAKEHEGPTKAAAQHSIEVALSQPQQPQLVSNTLLTGILHGCSGSGHLLGVMPALAMPTWVCAAVYLSAFGFGTMLAMSVFTAIVGEASVQMGERLNQPDVPAKLSFVSSVFALTMGTLWTTRACVALALPQQMLQLLLALSRKIMFA